MITTISHAEYRARPGLSSGFIRDLLRSPLHAKHKQQEQRDSEALAFGRYVHAAILEPADINAHFIIKPEGLDRRTKAGRQEYEELVATGKQIITMDDVERANAMRENVLKHPIAANYLLNLAPDTTEQSAFWVQNGLECKARFDHIATYRGAIVDIKTTANASPHEFEKSISHHGYHIQGCHYLNGAMANGLRVNQFILIAVESQAPHAVKVYRLDQGYIDAAQSQIESAFLSYRQCLKSGKWPGYSEEVQDVLCPAWMCEEVG